MAERPEGVVGIEDQAEVVRGRGGGRAGPNTVDEVVLPPVRVDGVDDERVFEQDRGHGRGRGREGEGIGWGEEFRLDLGWIGWMNGATSLAWGKFDVCLKKWSGLDEGWGLRGLGEVGNMWIEVCQCVSVLGLSES